MLAAFEERVYPPPLLERDRVGGAGVGRLVPVADAFDGQVELF